MNHHQSKHGQITRRVIIRGGLAGLAATLAQTSLIGCESTAPSRTDNEERDAIDLGLTPDAETAMTDRNDAERPIDEALADYGVDSEISDAEMVDAEVVDLEVEPDLGVPPEFPQRVVPAPPVLASLIPMIGPLQDADELGLKLPEGFSARIIARSREPVSGLEHMWHSAPDGGATYPTEDGGWIYVSNSEISILGGVSAIRFSAEGEVVDAYPILERTNKNCAGGVTPWHTWLSCEEVSRGRVYECSPWGDQEAILRPALGTFNHEAVAIDPVNGHLYLTEDERDGRLYRFTADQVNDLGHPDLRSGVLEVATVSEEGQVMWTALPDPTFEGETPTREQVPSSTSFNGGEGIWYHQSVIYFSTKGDNKVWAYHVDRAELETIYDGRDYLDGVDNITVSCCGDVLVAEDGGDMRIVAITPSGELKTLIQVEGQDDSEITGPAFDPSGTRLYFSSQRGVEGRSTAGITYEVTGPFHRVM